MRLGVDIGGTNIKFAVVDDGKIVYRNCIDTADSVERILSDISAEAVKLTGEYEITSMGVGTPGYIKDGLVTTLNMAFSDTPLAAELSARTGLDVKIDNDANCAALGEIMFGATTDCENIILVTLGTGVGGGVIMNRKITHGRNSLGELGHIIIDMNGRECPCGLKGCWERYAAASALVRDSIKAAELHTDSILYEIYKREGRLSGRLVFEALERGCPVMAEVYDKYLDYLAAGINSLVNIFGPDAIVLSGGISKEGEKITAPLKKKLATDVNVVVSSLQNDAGAMGAAML